MSFISRWKGSIFFSYRPIGVKGQLDIRKIYNLYINFKIMVYFTKTKQNITQQTQSPLEEFPDVDCNRPNSFIWSTSSEVVKSRNGIHSYQNNIWKKIYGLTIFIYEVDM